MTPCGAAGAGTAVSNRAARQRGFSIVELVVVIGVIGLLAAVAVPRFFDNSAFRERVWYDEVAAAIGYARSVAVASGCPVRVTLAASAYALAQQAAVAGHCDPADTSWPVTVTLSDGQDASGTAPPGVTLAPPTTLVIDAAGRTNLAGDLTLTVGPRSLTVRAGSAYVTP